MSTAYTRSPTRAYLFAALEDSHSGYGTPEHGPKASKQSHFESLPQAYGDLKKRALRNILASSPQANLRSSSTGITFRGKIVMI